jgi:hypothetical protein
MARWKKVMQVTATATMLDKLSPRRIVAILDSRFLGLDSRCLPLDTFQRVRKAEWS